MKTYFKKEVCSECGLRVDPIEKKCPYCGKEFEDKRDFHAFDHQIHYSWPKQLILLAIGYGGQQILAILLALIAEILFVATHPSATQADIVAYMSETNVQFALNSIIYVAIAGAFFLFLCLTKKLPTIFRSFADWKAIVAGVVGFVAILGIGVVYSVIVSAVYTALGATPPGVNANETALRGMIRAFPVLCIIVFGIIGPFCEEITYRVGLFGFLGRLGKPLAYLLGALCFGLIHFNWNILIEWDANAFVTELVNLPSYVGAGAALCFLYDRFGFAAGFTAHSLNNLFSIVMTMVQE